METNCFEEEETTVSPTYFDPDLENTSACLALVELARETFILFNIKKQAFGAKQIVQMELQRNVINWFVKEKKGGGAE